MISNLFVFVGCQVAEDIVAFVLQLKSMTIDYEIRSRVLKVHAYLKNSNSLVEVVVFHGGGAVEHCERRVALHHERVRLASVVQIVTQARHEHAQHLQQTPVTVRADVTLADCAPRST